METMLKRIVNQIVEILVACFEFEYEEILEWTHTSEKENE